MRTNMSDIWQYMYSLLPKEIARDINKCLYIDVVKVNPETLEIDDDLLLNTQVRIWLEFGLPTVIYPSGEEVYEIIPGVNIPLHVMKGIKNKEYMITPTHDIELDVGGNTFEEAFNELYIRLKQKYGNITSSKQD